MQQQQAMPQQPSQYGSYQTPPQETPAASYMQQYQQSSQMAMNAGPPTPAPGPPQQGNYHHPTASQSTQQQQPAQWSNQQQQQHQQHPTPVAGAMSYGNQSHYAQPQTQQPAAMIQQNPPPRSNTQTAPPTGQFSDTGKPILFYVKALYDYQATTEEEFSFTAGDIMAVWETNPDGWWQGELLDDVRRRAGANTFPSNFVSLLN
jgi:hypothetical protein